MNAANCRCGSRTSRYTRSCGGATRALVATDLEVLAELGVRPRYHVHGDKLADARGRLRARFCGRLDRTDVPDDRDGHQAAAYLVPPDDRHLRRLTHAIPPPHPAHLPLPLH